MDDDFTFFPGVPGGQCKIPATPLSFPPRDHHQLGLVGSPPPWLLAAAAVAEDGDSDAEKMDLLWEDFNEELARTPPVCPLSPLCMKAKDAWLLDVVVDDDVTGGGGAEQWRRMYSGSVVRRRRRWSLLLMLRLLKNLFLAKNKRNPRTAPI